MGGAANGPRHVQPPRLGDAPQHRPVRDHVSRRRAAARRVLARWRPLGSAAHLWEHYLFTGDKGFSPPRPIH